MNDPMKQAWNDVAEGFSTLGGMMKERYQTGGSDDGGGAATASGMDDAGAALRSALDRFAAAGREVGDRAGDVVRDDEVRAQAKLAAASLSDALAATMNLLGDQLGGLFKPSKDDGPAADIAASEPPADDARQ